MIARLLPTWSPETIRKNGPEWISKLNPDQLAALADVVRDVQLSKGTLVSVESPESRRAAAAARLLGRGR